MKTAKFIISIFCLVTIMAFFARSGDAADCNVTKEGTLIVSPGELQFYVTQEQLTNPNPITVQVNGFAYPDPDGDGCATTTSWEETTDFCWVASKTAQWITLNGNPNNIVRNTSGGGSFTVGVDIDQLLENQNIYGGNVTIYDGNVTVTATISMDPHTIPATSIDIPVRIYVNALRYAAEKSVATTDWLDMIMNVPVMEDISGALYVLAEHPSLAPGQVFAYRWDSVNGTRFDLFSQWGHPVEGAEDRFYVEDIKDTPIAIPFSSDEGTGKPVIPYDPTDVAVSTSDHIPNVKAYIPITFGGGLRLIGMEGDWIIRAIVGDSNDISNWSSWRELLYYVLHIRPVTGTWVVTEEFEGESYTYIDDTGTIYPMILHEERSDLSGVWNSPVAQTPLIVTYANSTDQICDTLSVQGHRLDVSSCVQPGGYEVYFVEPSIWGNVEYLYKITTLDVTGGGYLEGTWQYRFAGQADWSIPQDFSAVSLEVVIPLDPSCNCYLVNGTVNGYATGFIVDTGAFAVLLDLADASYMGLVDEETGGLNSRCDQTPVQLGGVGGTITAYKCYADIEIEGRLSKQNVEVYLSEGQSALLGMTFLDTFHISTNSEDGTMIIAP
ncbi:MAG: retroviral-like aspartic protease family protein [Deltaproteobacteria bacterium]|nr:retroviral-like aspartic protease family protein [Deltaproteobacteria bacterium]